MIGILPAAGKAERMNGLPKMLLPIPGGTLIDRLCQRLAAANPELIFVLPSNRTFSPLAYLEDGKVRVWGVGDTDTMSETLTTFEGYVRQNYRNEACLFGMPDTYVEDEDAFVKLCVALDEGADVAVGVFETRPEQRSKMGMIMLDDDHVHVYKVVDKPKEPPMTWAIYGWGVLAWKPVFWEYINATDPHVGYALPKAIAAGLDVRAVFMDGGYWDCGTPEEYFDLICHLYGQKVSV